MPLLFATLCAIAIILVLGGIALPLLARDAVHDRLSQFADRPRSLEELELEVPFSERIMGPMLRRLTDSANRMARRRNARNFEKSASSLQVRLNLSGVSHRWTPSDYLGVKALWAIIVGAVVFTLLVVVGQPLYSLMGGAAGALIGFIGPDFYLSHLTRGRQHQIQRTLPDAMDLLVICVEAGLGFDSALARLCQKQDNQLTREFARALQEMRVGRPRREALRDVINRTEVPDLANFISAIIQADQLGVSVSQVLSIQADQMRTVRRQRVEELAAQAPIKMLIPMLLFIFPALCIVLLGPLWPSMANTKGV